MPNSTLGRRKFDPDEVARAIIEGRGLITATARRIGCSPQTLNWYINEYPQCQQALKEAKDSVKDLAEARLYQAIDRGEPWAIQFYLKQQGRDRGYGEQFDLRAWLIERAKQLAAERGLDEAVVLEQAHRLIATQGENPT